MRVGLVLVQWLQFVATEEEAGLNDFYKQRADYLVDCWSSMFAKCSSHKQVNIPGTNLTRGFRVLFCLKPCRCALVWVSLTQIKI